MNRVRFALSIEKSGGSLFFGEKFAETGKRM